MKNTVLKMHPVQRLGWVTLASVLLLALGVVWDNWGDLLRPQNDNTALTAPATEAQIEQGRYLALAGNCMACHTTRGGTPFAGGRRIDTPFGGVYSSNLTPDPETGLGRWTADDFWQAMHHGRSKGGRLLTPAFPYNHTSVVSREDSDAVFAWLQTQAPVVQAPTAPPLPFQFVGRLADQRDLQVFLQSGEKLYVVRQGDVIEDTYRLDRVSASELSLVYLPLHQSQTLSVGSAP